MLLKSWPLAPPQILFEINVYIDAYNENTSGGIAQKHVPFCSLAENSSFNPKIDLWQPLVA